MAEFMAKIPTTSPFVFIFVQKAILGPHCCVSKHARSQWIGGRFATLKKNCVF